MNGELINLIYEIKMSLDKDEINQYEKLIKLLTKVMINKKHYDFPQNIPEYITFIKNRPINYYISEGLNEEPFVNYGGTINKDISDMLDMENSDEKVQKNIYEILKICRNGLENDAEYWSNTYRDIREFICDNYSISKRNLDVILNSDRFPEEINKYIKKIYIQGNEFRNEKYICPICGKLAEFSNTNEGQCTQVCNYYMSIKNLSFSKKIYNEKTMKLHDSIYKYILQPNISEKNIYTCLKRELKGVEIQLYPNVDEYDISISDGDRYVNLDVKDKVSPDDLVRRLKESNSENKLISTVDNLCYLVIPNHRVKIYKLKESRNYMRDLKIALGNECMNIEVIQERYLLAKIKDYFGGRYD